MNELHSILPSIPLIKLFILGVTHQTLGTHTPAYLINRIVNLVKTAFSRAEIDSKTNDRIIDLLDQHLAQYPTTRWRTCSFADHSARQSAQMQENEKTREKKSTRIFRILFPVTSP